jgi:hypothetical protein
MKALAPRKPWISFSKNKEMLTPRLPSAFVLLAFLSACSLAGSGSGESVPSIQPPADDSVPSPPASSTVINPADLEYLGAFRLPENRDRPFTFDYGGNAMTFNPSGDPAGNDDSFPGSLFITGHDRLPYGDLPDGSQVAEIDIPIPLADSLDSLNRAAFLQDFQDVTAGYFTEMEEIVRTGLLYLDHPETGPLIHIAWGQHIEPDPTVATHGWFSPDLSAPAFHGPWFIADQSWYSVNDYMLEIPAVWADQYARGYPIGTGRFKDGGWSGMGPVLIAYQPWDESGNPYPSGASIPSITLLHYAASTDTSGIERALIEYQHPDEWSGAAWLTTPSGRSAVLFAGAKSNGSKYWYGYLNPAGPEFPCVDEEITDFLTCRLENGSSCPPGDFQECPAHPDYRGWWTTRWDAQFIFYDPADLARVALAEMESWEPQPYAILDIDEYLYNNPSGVETEMIGTGAQRRYRIGDIAYDRLNGFLYVLELYADGAAPVVHVWQIK